MNLRISNLKESNEFLNDLYANVTSAIFLADRDARLVSFNNAFHSLFYKPEDQLLGELCGNAIGCAFQVEEGVDCGTTSKCADCDLRNNIITSFTEKVPVYKSRLDRDFKICGRLIRKHFVFTTKYAIYQGHEYVLVLVDDCTDLILAQEQLKTRNRQLELSVKELTAQLLASALDLDLSKSRTEELGKELRHRVGNTLQLIVSLLQMLSDNEACPDSTYEALSLYLSAIIAAYQHVNYESDSPGVDAGKLLPALCALLEDHRQTNSLSAHTEVTILSLDIAVPLSIALVDLLLGNLTRTAAAMHLRLVVEQAQLIIDIGLSGKQAPPELECLPEHSLCALMVRQLSGRIACLAGDTIRLTVPLPAGRKAAN